MKYFYCDSCFLITCYQDGCLKFLSQYKDQFYISNIQIIDELIKPEELAKLVRECVTVLEDRDEIMIKTNEFVEIYNSLSFYDCLAMAFCFCDGYCLITDDKHLIKKCKSNNIAIKTSQEIKKRIWIWWR